MPGGSVKDCLYFSKTIMFSKKWLWTSSRETVNHYYKVHVLKQERDYPGDFKPIVIDEQGRIVDGHHRHAAHTFLGRKTIWAYVPKSVAENF
jgi:hypothetical protein